jgi:peptidoglycan hydrolase-like protein with peptidoglycan-binding domain
VERPVYVARPVPAAHSVEADVQAALARRGYYGGPVDGDIGPQSRAAIRAFQVDRGLPVTGHIDRALLRSLHLL